MAFDKEAYWRNRKDTKAFTTDWQAWRAKCKAELGVHMVASNPKMFDQKAYKAFVEYQKTMATSAPDPLATTAAEADSPSIDISTTVAGQGPITE